MRALALCIAQWGWHPFKASAFAQYVEQWAGDEAVGVNKLLVVTGKAQEAAQVLHAVGARIVEYLVRFCRVRAEAFAFTGVDKIF